MNPVNEAACGYVSVEQFVDELLQKYRGVGMITDAVSYGYRTGWLEDQDVVGRKQPLRRSSAARILHQFMRYELHEQDEINISPAGRLQDLYDCRSCVMHIAQVYIKGIMDGCYHQEERFVFGMDDNLLKKEANSILNCVFHKEERSPRVEGNQTLVEAEVISLKQAEELLQTKKDVLLIDVRTNNEFLTGHMKNAVNIPLAAMLKNPYAVSSRRDQYLLLYCTEGHKSSIAAQCLLQAGYEKVYSFAWENEKI